MAFSNRWAKKTKGARAARQSRMIGQAGQASTNAATDVAFGTKRVVIGPRHGRIAAEGGGDARARWQMWRKRRQHGRQKTLR